jgi:hypothetical protein
MTLVTSTGGLHELANRSVTGAPRLNSPSLRGGFKERHLGYSPL